MAKMRKYGIYILWIVIGIVFSNFIIAVGLNSNYRHIDNKGNADSKIEIIQSEATKVNGRLRGVLHIDSENPIQEKYLKIEFFSERDVNMGSKYVEINKTYEEMPFEVFFKLNNVSYYKTSFVNEKDPQGEIEFIPKDLNKKEIVLATLLALLFFK